METLVSNLESFFVQNPQVDARYRTALRRYEPELAESTSVLLVEGCFPLGYKALVQPKIEYIPKWEEHPEREPQVRINAVEEWALVETELRDRAKDTRVP